MSEFNGVSITIDEKGWERTVGKWRLFMPKRDKNGTLADDFALI